MQRPDASSELVLRQARQPRSPRLRGTTFFAEWLKPAISGLSGLLQPFIDGRDLGGDIAKIVLLRISANRVVGRNTSNPLGLCGQGGLGGAPRKDHRQ